MQKFTRLTLVEKYAQMALFLCDCGTQKLIRYRNVKSGQVRSCGCLRKESCSKTGQRKGSEKHNAKLKESDIPKIKSMRSKGNSLQYCAIKFGVHAALIGAICKETRWVHAQSID